MARWREVNGNATGRLVTATDWPLRCLRLASSGPPVITRRRSNSGPQALNPNAMPINGRLVACVSGRYQAAKYQINTVH